MNQETAINLASKYFRKMKKRHLKKKFKKHESGDIAKIILASGMLDERSEK